MVAGLEGRDPETPWPSSAMLSTVTASEPAEPAPARDPHRPARLLQAERDALLPILHRTPDRAFDRPTACPGWSVRDVLAHCAAALSRVAAGNLHAFTPALNELDVAKRRAWPLTDILAELSAGYQEAGKAITDAGGKLDVIAPGEWLHGGGLAKQDRVPETLHTTRPTMMRLFAGRPADASDYQLTGATAAELIVF
jgi:Mycothiol maleylpyruvate isomerase N-terminal domain